MDSLEMREPGQGENLIPFLSNARNFLTWSWGNIFVFPGDPEARGKTGAGRGDRAEVMAPVSLPREREWPRRTARVGPRTPRAAESPPQKRHRSRGVASRPGSSHTARVSRSASACRVSTSQAL